MPTAEAMIVAAPRQACEGCGFERAVLFRVQGKELLTESFRVNGDPQAAARLLDHRCPITGPPLPDYWTTAAQLPEYRRPHPAAPDSRGLETKMALTAAADGDPAERW